LIGKEGIVSEIKGPKEVLVFIDGEYWLAKVEGKVLKGDKVLVTGVEGLILKVRRT
ncbi:MAG: Nodulation efficiency protein D-like protein (nefD), partial [Desulfurococcales archaeon ex4484_217_2]